MAEFTFKIIVIGPAAVGKSSLIRRFVDNEFYLDYRFTIGVDFLTKMVEYKPNKTARLTLWDIGGQDRFKLLRRSFYDGANGALVVFDLSRAQTFTKMKEWITDMNNLMKIKIPFIILGNKVDLLPEVGNVIDRIEPLQYAEEQNSSYIETSAKTGDNVEKAFKELTQRILKRFDEF